MQVTSKPVSASAVNDQTAIVFPDDLNTLGTLFGGRVMELCDKVCAVVAKRHTGRNCVTLGIDSVRFLASARHGDILVFKAAVNRAWRTSLEIGVKVLAEDFRTLESTHVVSAYFTFVGVDEEMRPTPINSVEPQTADEVRRFEQAELRRKSRLASQPKD
ncbi:MAG TPA: acyl-CoA thioesterase [Tepidisphaeraceae bacterium]|nr:acyl-CoA thioesterase [Tepidisphaeraceae bacterium]